MFVRSLLHQHEGNQLTHESKQRDVKNTHKSTTTYMLDSKDNIALITKRYYKAKVTPSFVYQ